MAGEKKLQWMYAGPNNELQSEDFLLGKKVDTNYDRAKNEEMKVFTGFDAIVHKDASSSADAASTSTFGLLDVDTVRKEDPLVAIRVKEEQTRRELLENPLHMKHLQKIVLETVAKKMYKSEKKKNKREEKSRSPRGSRRTRRSRSRDDRSRSARDFQTSSSKASFGSRSRNEGSRDVNCTTSWSSSAHTSSRGSTRDSRGSPRRRRHDSSSEDDVPVPNNTNHRSRADSRRSNAISDHRRGSTQKQDKSTRKRHDSNSSTDERSKEPKPSYKVTIRDELRRSDDGGGSDDDDDRKPARQQAFGLSYISRDAADNAAAQKRKIHDAMATAAVSRKKEVESKQTVIKAQASRGEKFDSAAREAKLAEMQKNAAWHDVKQRGRIDADVQRRAREADEESKRSRGAGFIAPMLSEAASSGSVAERVRSNKHKIQRVAGDAMHEKSSYRK